MQEIQAAWLTYKQVPVEGYAQSVFLDDSNKHIYLNFLPKTAELDAIGLNHDYSIEKNYHDYTFVGGKARKSAFQAKDLNGKYGYTYDLNRSDAVVYAYANFNNGQAAVLAVNSQEQLLGVRKIFISQDEQLIYVTPDLIGKEIKARIPIVYEKLCVFSTNNLEEIQVNLLLTSSSPNEPQTLRTYFGTVNFELMPKSLSQQLRKIVVQYDQAKTTSQTIDV